MFESVVLSAWYRARVAPRKTGSPVDLAQRRSTRPSKTLETFPNPSPARDYEIRFECPEFTCVCPMTGQPDFAVIRIAYVPDRLCVELKSLKLYLWSYRNEGAFCEELASQIAHDIFDVIQPHWCTVVIKQAARGGITIEAEATVSREQAAITATTAAKED